MDPLAWILILVLGVPLLALLVLVVLAASTRFEFQKIEVRGGHLRGAIAAALAKILVADTKAFQLPLVVVLEKHGPLGRSTPLLGGAHVRDIEWRIHVDGQHVSTLTEASSVRIGTFDTTLHLPVNADVHLPEGLLKTYARYRKSKRAGAEIRIDVEGHVRVRSLGVTREVPVRETQWQVVGDPLPVLDQVRFQPVGAGQATLDIHLHSPYREHTLAATLTVQVHRERRMLPDPLLAAHEAPVVLAPGATHHVSTRIRLEAPPDTEPVPLEVRILWDGERLRRQPPDDATTPEPREPPMNLTPKRGPPGGSLSLRIAPAPGTRDTQ